MNFEKIIIPDQKNFYKFKHKIQKYDFEMDYKTREYSNFSELSSDAKEEIIKLLEDNNFRYEIIIEKVENESEATQLQYKIFSLNKDNFFIVQKISNEKVGYINYSDFKLKILDIKNNIYKVISCERNESTHLISVVLKCLIYEEGLSEEIPHLSNILINLSKKYAEELEQSEKIKNFKYYTISKINDTNKDGFLCNNIPGFFPETSFFIKNKRIYSNYTDNFLDRYQEEKIWKYLYGNKHKVGKYIEPTLNDLFIGRKISVNINNQAEYVLINKVYKSEGEKIKIEVYNGIETIKISREFEKDELCGYIKAAR